MKINITTTVLMSIGLILLVSGQLTLVVGLIIYLLAAMFAVSVNIERAKRLHFTILPTTIAILIFIFVAASLFLNGLFFGGGLEGFATWVKVSIILSAIGTVLLTIDLFRVFK